MFICACFQRILVFGTESNNEFIWSKSLQPSSVLKSQFRACSCAEASADITSKSVCRLHGHYLEFFASWFITLVNNIDCLKPF